MTQSGRNRPCVFERLEPRLLLNGAPVTFGTYTGPELDWYQPCDGGDNNINFEINVHDINVAAIEKASLRLAVWDVDYDCGNACGGLCERDPVYLNGHRLTSPQAYLTGANNQWSTVTFDVDPSLIVLGENRVDIDIDVLSGSCWCVTCDFGELIIETGERPEIEDIIIDAKPDVWWNPFTWGVNPNPTTTKDVKFTAKLKNMTGYEIVKIAWTSDAFNPTTSTTADITVKPMAGKHGKDRNITAVLTYRKVGETQTYTAKAYSEKFNLFFDKNGDEDSDGIPNWFEYWNALDVGDRHGVTSVVYDAGMTGADGQYNWGSSTIRIGPGAAGQDYKPPGTCIIGIDNFAQTLTHEALHYHHWNTWFKGKTVVDTDHDELPDWYEDVGDDGLPNTGDAHEGDGIFNGAEIYDVTAEKTTGNPWADDEEWVTHKETDGNRGPHSLDWANPGKQTTPPEGDPWVPPEKADKIFPGEPGAGAVFTGGHSDYGIDADGDGTYDVLAVELEMTVTVEDEYLVTAGLRDARDNMTWASQIVSWSSGLQTAHLEFDGPTLRQRRVDGPYEVVMLNCYNSATEFVDYSDGGMLTNPYLSTEFDALSIDFGAPFADAGLDTDADGQFNYLDISVPLSYCADGTGRIFGWLVDDAGIELGYAQAAFTAIHGGSDTVHLLFDGETIRQKRRDGPYHLRYVVAELDDEPQDVIYEAHITPAYSWSQFEATDGVFHSPAEFTDQGVDLNGNGFFDVLRIHMEVDIVTAGRYVVVGRLFSSDGESLGEASIDRELSAGAQSFALDFNGRHIAELGKSGPYILEYAYLYDGNGSLLDALPAQYATAAYDWWQFEGVSVRLTGNYTDQGVDTDGDGVFDLLRITVEVEAINGGNYDMNGRLIDQKGHEIAWASTSSSFAAGQTKTLVLDFPAAAISANGVNGPFFLRDVYVYNTGNPTQNDCAYEAMTTKFYGVGDFRQLVNLNSSVTMATVRSSYDRRTGQQTCMVKITNTSTQAIVSPSRLVVQSLTAGVTVVNADASTPGGSPYICLGCLLPQGRLEPGRSVLVPVILANPLRLRFTFDFLLEGLLQS